MSTSLFTMSCPACGEVLSTDSQEIHSCMSCGRTYLLRFGHLVPVDPAKVLDAGLASAEGTR